MSEDEPRSLRGTRSLERNTTQKYGNFCHVFVNGDSFYPGTTMYFSHRLKTLDAVKDEITSAFTSNDRVVCARNIFTPTNGRRIQSLSDFLECQECVVAPNDRFYPLPYREIPEKTRIPRHKGFKKIDINKVYTPVQHAIEERLRKKSGRSFYLNEHVKGLILRVHTNGFNERPACPVAIRSKDRNNMYKIKESIETTMSLNPIVRMFNIINCGGYEENFVEIHDCSELEHNGHILVLTKNEKRIQPKLYSLNGKHNFSVATSPRSGQYYLYPSFPPEPRLDSKQYKHNQSLNKHKPLPSIGSSSKQSDAVSPFSNPPSQHGRGGRHSKGKAQNVDYDRDDAGVYRAKGQNNVRGAQQVNDTYETHTERPIDQMEAEEVDEERIQTEKGTSIPPGTELNKQPSVEQKQHEKETHVDKEVKSKVASKDVNKTDSTTYRVSDLPPKTDDNDKDKVSAKNDMKEKEEERISSGKDKYTDSTVKADRDEIVDNDKGQTTDDLEQGIPKQLSATDDNGIMNQAPLSTVSPDKKSTGSQANTPPNKTREERTSEEQGIHRIDEFDDELFGDSHYGGNSSLNKSVSNNPRASTPQSRGESRRKQQIQRENEAATRIQAGARGYKVRKEHRQRMEAAQHEQVEHETEVGGRRSVEDDLYRRQDAAATKIQAGYKGYKTRKEMNTKKAQVSEGEILDKPRSDNYAAAKIQAGYRGYKTRKEYNARRTFSKHGEPEKEASEYRKGDEDIAKEKAAVKIQAGYRGYKARKAYSSRKEAKKVVNDLMANERQDEILDSENQEKAATKIQAGFRGHRARKEYSLKREAKQKEERQIDNAATKIQAGFKGYQTRKKVAEERQAHLKEESAATKIQAGYRGYKTRKEIKSKVINRFVEGKQLDTAHLSDPVPVLAVSNISKGAFNSRSNKDLVTSLQAALRGYNARKGLGTANFPVLVASETNRHVSAIQTHNDLVTSVQAALRGYNARKTFISKNNAATKIQAAYKTYKKRVLKGFANKSFEFEAFEKYKAAIKINSIVRGFIERTQTSKKFSDSKEIKNTPSSSWINHRETDINFRHTPQGPSYAGFEKCYWEDSNIKMYSDQIKKNAASKVQAAFFSFVTRNKYYAWKARQAKKYVAAEKIKSCVKGYITRIQLRNANASNGLNDDDEFVRVAEPKSAVEIYGSVNIDTKLSENITDKTHHKDFSDKDSCFTEIKSLSENYLREKSLGYETISASGEVEKEGDSVKEIEDEMGEINAIAKHVYAISCLQAAFRAYKMRKEFHELLSGGGELIDIAKVDRAVSALRKEFRFRSAKMRRLAAHQFNTDQGGSSSNWWITEGENDTDTESSNVFSQTDIHNKQPITSANAPFSDVILTNDDLLVSEEQNESAVTERIEGSEVPVNFKSMLKIQAGFKGFMVRKQFLKGKSKKKAVKKIQDVFRSYTTRKQMSNDLYDTINITLQEHYDASRVSFEGEKDTVSVCAMDMSKTSSTAVQAACRGFLYRKHFSDITKSKESASNILAAFKGLIVRKRHLSSKLMRGQLIGRGKSLNAAESICHKEEYNASVIQSACRGYLFRRKGKSVFANSVKANAICKIQTIFSGHVTRRKQKNSTVDYELVAKDGTSETDWSETTGDDIDTGSIKQASTLKLQAAFSAYQTRKVFISLTKLVEDSSVSDVGTYKLERMGSLSETDDFKLKHKSITKIQTALEEHRMRNASGVAVTVNGGFSDASNFSKSRYAGNRSHKGRTLLSPIKSRSNVSSAYDAKFEKGSQVTRHEKKEKESRQKLSKTKVSKIEKYIKLNLAASTIQASFRGCKKREVVLQRKRVKSANLNHMSLQSSSKKTEKLNNEIPFESLHKTDKDLIHARTASVKLEAERRKEIRKRVAAKESIQVVKSKAEKLKAKKEKVRQEQIGANINEKSVTSGKQAEKRTERQMHINAKTNYTTPISVKKAAEKKENKCEISTKRDDNLITSARNVTTVSHVSGSLEESLSKIQNACPGEEVQSESELRKPKRNFNEEYETWKKERINAAIMIQAGWRGYRVRKDIMKQEDTVFGSFENNDEPQPLIVINLGRSKSEIARAEERYHNASMIQMVYRTSKMRRKIKIRMAVSRYERNQAVSKIQAYYKAFAMRKSIEQKKAAVRLQAAFKAHRARQINGTEKQLKRNNAVSRIQAAWRSFKARAVNKIDKEARRKQAEANQASLVIQAGYRGFNERKQLLKKKNEVQYLASTRIQSTLKGALYRKNVREKRNAATYIISAGRSYKTRLELKRLKDKQNAASRIQYACRAYAKRLEVKLFKDKMAKENKAGNIISSSLRGMKARKNEIIRREEMKKRQKSALKIQSFYRGYLGRKMAEIIKKEKIRKENLLMKQRTSAVKIQSVYRGHIGRKIARHERYIKELYENSSEIIELLLGRTFMYLEKKWRAAVRVQSSVRGHMTRMRHAVEQEKARVEAVRKKHEMDKIATVIQTVFRAKKRRTVIAKARKMKAENIAAVKIQSLYRGYSTRLEIEREKIKLARLSPIVLSPDSGKVSVDLELLQNARAIIAFHKNATLLQAAFRAYMTRINTQERLMRKLGISKSLPRQINSGSRHGRSLSEEEKAAVSIQKTFRGYSDRKAYQSYIIERRKKEKSAANVIKVSMKGYTTRKERRNLRDKIKREGSAEVRQQKYLAAGVIAAVFRGYRKRKHKAALRVEM